uniref:G_PROTEIN_RECEP_F1_2 domain-containing protein n=1 Tax=Caenorhabditis tropicalis TaxID=1561998 RepID=A0A1I7TN78_9PELO
MEVIMVITQSLPAQVRLQYQQINSRVEDYSVIGALSLKTLPSIINFGLISGSVVLAPFICFFFRNKILTRINSQLDKHSKQRRTLIRVFVKGLTIQAFLPLVFYLPVFILYFICILTHSEILFQQYFMTVVPALPALVDPFVTLYFVTPYRRRLKIWMRIEKESKVMPVITSQIN